MRILAIDFGEKRIGLAISDERQKMALPLKVFVFQKQDNFAEFWNELNRIANLYQRQIEIIVGNPLNPRQTRIQTKVQAFFNFLKNKREFKVQLYDERFTSKIADDYLRYCQIKANKRKEMIDSVSAAVLLQEYLDFCGQKTAYST